MVAEMIDTDLWKETIKHAFVLKELENNHGSRLLKRKGTFAKLIHYNMGLSLLESGFGENSNDDLRMVEEVFENKPREYPKNVMDFENAADINDFQYLQNIDYIAINSIPRIDQINVSSKTQKLIMTAGFDLYEEHQNIINKNRDFFNEITFNYNSKDKSIQIITREEYLDLNGRIPMSHLSRETANKVMRKDPLGRNSNLLWGISEKHKLNEEKKVLMKIDPEFRMQELEKESKAMDFKNYDNTTPLFKKEYSREKANSLFEHNPLELAKQIKNYHEKEPNYPSYELNTADLALEEVKDRAEESGVERQELFDLEIDQEEPPMSDEEIAERKAEAEREDAALDQYEEQQEQNYESFEARGIMKQIDNNLKPLLDEENISKDQFESGINLLKEKNELSDNQVPFDQVYGELLVEEGIRIKDDKYLTGDQTGSRELNGKEYSKLLRNANWELEAYKSDKKFRIMNPEKDTAYSDKEKLYQESLKELKDPEVKQDFRVAAAIIKRESGSFDMIKPFEPYTTDKELATTMANFKMDKLLKDPIHPYDLKTDFPNYGDKTNALMKIEMQTYLNNRNTEVKKYIPKDELVQYEARRSTDFENYRISRSNKVIPNSHKIDELNLGGVDEIVKAFRSNESFEEHITKYGHLYSRYSAINALVVSNQIDKKVQENPNFSGDSMNIGIRKNWENKCLYPKDSDAIGFVFVPNKDGRISNNKEVSDVQIKPFFTSDSFRDYGKDHKDKSAYADFKSRKSSPEYGISKDTTETYVRGALSEVNKNIKDPLIKAATEFSARKELGLNKGESFKVPAGVNIKDISDPSKQLNTLNKIHHHSMKVIGIVRSGMNNIKKNIKKPFSKSVTNKNSKQKSSNKSKTHGFKR